MSRPELRPYESSQEMDSSEREESKSGAGGSVAAVSSAERIASSARRFASGVDCGGSDPLWLYDEV